MRCYFAVTTDMRGIMLRILRNLMILSFAGLLAAACNTIEGAGEDIQSAGERIEEAAD
jgi:predicted small secreted protein